LPRFGIEAPSPVLPKVAKAVRLTWSLISQYGAGRLSLTGAPNER
jgi:hypothetical protein